MPAMYRPSWVEVDLDAIAHNVRQIKKYLNGTSLCAVVKADAYGLGAVAVARTLVESGVDCLGVVTLDEAVELRNAGIEVKILNMGPVFPDQADAVIEHDLEQIVYESNVAKALSKAAQTYGREARVHFKIDAGMSRYGAAWTEAVGAFSGLVRHPHLRFVGAMTHFPMSDAVDKSFALLQIHRFKSIRRELEAQGYDIPVWHICNSGGVLDLPDAHMEMVRIGLLLYGYFPSEDVRRPFPLKPAMQVKTRIAELRTIERGDSVGYGRRYIAEKAERIAVLPIGYADGYDRGLRNIGQVLIHGQMAPIVGGLCMDACFVRVSDLPQTRVKDVVTIMGRDGGVDISPHDIAGLIGSVSYEVMARWGRRLPRVYLKNAEIVAVRNELTEASESPG